MATIDLSLTVSDADLARVIAGVRIALVLAPELTDAEVLAALRQYIIHTLQTAIKNAERDQARAAAENIAFIDVS